MFTTQGHAMIFEPSNLVVCGDTYCRGTCGHPALVTSDAHGREVRAHGAQVASGLVFQPWRAGPSQWAGARVAVPDDLRDAALRRVWP